MTAAVYFSFSSVLGSLLVKLGINAKQGKGSLPSVGVTPTVYGITRVTEFEMKFIALRTWRQLPCLGVYVL